MLFVTQKYCGNATEKFRFQFSYLQFQVAGHLGQLDSTYALPNVSTESQDIILGMIITQAVKQSWLWTDQFSKHCF